jgi:hypothetical protein
LSKLHNTEEYNALGRSEVLTGNNSPKFSLYQLLYISTGYKISYPEEEEDEEEEKEEGDISPRKVRKFLKDYMFSH